MRDMILSEIKRLAAAQGGQPPGKRTFANATGISEGKWRGVLWARWGDALAEAGFEPNEKKARFDTDVITASIALFAFEIGRVPTRAEMRLRRRVDPSFPSSGVFENHFATQADLIAALRNYGLAGGRDDLLAMLPPAPSPSTVLKATAVGEGWVYLLKAGDHYKIGRSDDLERRMREVRVALPEAVTLVHSIRTDDPPGIEAYWHRRFAERRANGEWFTLSSDDVRAFTRRSFQ